MKEETSRYLDKSKICLSNAHSMFAINLSNDAARSAYLAAFHAAQSYIFERTGKIAKTHQGVQREFHRLAMGEPSIDQSYPKFLSYAYNLKAVADYETGPDSDIPIERTKEAIETAGRFVACIAAVYLAE